ncbi:Type 2 glycosyltransferase [Exophiala dermatitidis]
MDSPDGDGDGNQLVWTIFMAFVALLQHPSFPFIFLFVFRYLRLVVHIVSFWLYKPSPVRQGNAGSEKQCTVIIPTVDPENADFHKCLLSIIENGPLEIHIVTVGRRLQKLTKQILRPFQAAYPGVGFLVSSTDVANKRQQVAHAVPHVRTPFTFLVDDHVIWPSTNFLRTAIAPFEHDIRVGGVGTNKRVRRETHTGFFAPFHALWNVMGALYLERHNFEIRATNSIDGGVFVISGRTCAYRTAILQDPAFLAGYTNERFLFGLFGPLNADDDNFITRWLVTNGWKIKIQYCQDAIIETSVGTFPKFLSQCLRWSRTTWRSNTCSLLTDRSVYCSQPWCVYAVYLTSLVNFALFYDAALIYTFSRTDFYSSSPQTLMWLGGWILGSKLVKLVPYFLRHPLDLVYLPGYFAFAYFHSFIKLYAGLTFWVTAWGGRDLDKVNDDQGDSGDDDGSDDDDYRSNSTTPVPRSRSDTPDPSWDLDDSEDQADADPLAPLFTPESSNDSSCYTARANRYAARARRGPTTPAGKTTTVQTPWGLVTPGTNNPRHLTPVNVLMTQLPGTEWPRTWEYTSRQSHGEYYGPRRDSESSSVIYMGQAERQLQNELAIVPSIEVDDYVDYQNNNRQVQTQQLLTPSTATPAAATQGQRQGQRQGSIIEVYDLVNYSNRQSQQLLTPPMTVTRAQSQRQASIIDIDDLDLDGDSFMGNNEVRDAQGDLCMYDLRSRSRTPQPRDKSVSVMSISSNTSSTSTSTGSDGEYYGYGYGSPVSTGTLSTKSSPSPSSGTPPADKTATGEKYSYSRTWVRGSPETCGRLHYDGDNLVRRRNHCDLEDKQFTYWT